MDVRNCPRCGKIYHYDGMKICPTCRRDDEKDYQTVKKYLYKNPGADISEVHKETEVDTDKIIEFLRQGRLEVGEGSNLLIECEICGAGITTGRFCNKCANNLQQELSSAVSSSKKEVELKSAKKEKDKFRVIDRYEKRK